MVYSGPTFYDDRTVFNTYMARRQQETSANESIEKPLIWQLLGDVNGLDILDLGCGEATIAHELFAKGCRSYYGIDGSDNMNFVMKYFAGVQIGYRGEIGYNSSAGS